MVVRPGSPLRASWATVNRASQLTVPAALKCSTLPSSRRTSPVVAIRVTRENGGQLAFDAFRGQSGEIGTFAPAAGDFHGAELGKPAHHDGYADADTIEDASSVGDSGALIPLRAGWQG